MPDTAGAVAKTAPAKINLALHVTGRRTDGYHLIESLVVFTTFGDRVTVAPAAHDVVEISGPYAHGLPVDGANLVVRARDAVRVHLAGTQFPVPHCMLPPSVLPDISPSRGEISSFTLSRPIATLATGETRTDGVISPLEGEMSGRTEGGNVECEFPDSGASKALPVSIHLEKKLPIASGIGGGSSDAAATLLALNRCWSVGLTRAQLATIGLPLGADIPMCLARRPLIARGIGEVIEPVTTFPALPLVLVNPGVGVSTARIFAALESRESPPLPPVPSALDFAALLGWLGRTRNDLMAPALLSEPVIGEAIDALIAQGAAFARMSGSGATCFGLFADMAMARRAARTVSHSRPDWFVVTTETTKA